MEVKPLKAVDQKRTLDRTSCKATTFAKTPLMATILKVAQHLWRCGRGGILFYGASTKISVCEKRQPLDSLCIQLERKGPARYLHRSNRLRTKVEASDQLRIGILLGNEVFARNWSARLNVYYARKLKTGVLVSNRRNVAESKYYVCLKVAITTRFGRCALWWNPMQMSLSGHIHNLFGEVLLESNRLLKFTSGAYQRSAYFKRKYNGKCHNHCGSG